MDLTPVTRIVVPWQAVAMGDRSAIEDLLHWQRPPSQLRRLRRCVDIAIASPTSTTWQSSPEIRRFLRGATFGAGFFLPIRSNALLAYALAQLDSISVIDLDRYPAVGVHFRTEAMIAVSHQIAMEAMSLCALAGLTEEEASTHCWELEVEIASKFNLD